MIASRLSSASFSRFHRLLRTAACTPRALQNTPLGFGFRGSSHGQQVSFFWRMTGAQDGSSDIGQKKKQKSIMTVWRPVSSQSVSYQASSSSDLGQDDKLEVTEGTEAFTVSSITEFESENIDITTGFKSDVSLEEEVKEGKVEEFSMIKHADSCTQDDRSSVSFEVGAPLIRFLKGKGSSMVKQIKEDTGAELIFPKCNDSSAVVIEGGTTEIVEKASKKLSMLLEEVMKSPKLDYSHFISLPLAIHPDLVEKLDYFQNSILGNAAYDLDEDLGNDSAEDTSDGENNQTERQEVAVTLGVQKGKEHTSIKIDALNSKSTSNSSTLTERGIHKSIFIKPKTFHLTVLMLKLYNKERVSAAAEVLQKISSKVIEALESRPVSVRLRGLMCMRGSPAKARVVYAPVTETGGEGRLLRACQVIIDAYVEAGLVLEKDAQQALKLHATLMNARHRKRSKGSKRTDSFDARHIFRVHGAKDWGEYLIPEVHLSQRFKFDEKGYYHCCASILLPK